MLPRVRSSNFAAYDLAQIYASIVGGDGSAAVTQQNYIDCIYSTLSAIGSVDFPR